MKFKVAVVQLKIDLKSVDKTMKRVEHYVKQASSKADIIVFPEYTISWKYLDSKNVYRDKFIELAKKYKIDIVAGSMLTGKKPDMHNSTYYIDNTGKVLAKYDKINLWHAERPSTKFGDKVAVFDTKFGKVGLIICWDLIFPEVFREMLKKGVEIVICPSYWRYEDAGVGLINNGDSEVVLVDSMCPARAFENEIIFIYCNAAGKYQYKNEANTLIGHSQITTPFKGCIKKLNHNREEMFIEEVDTRILKTAENVYKIRMDMEE